MVSSKRAFCAVVEDLAVQRAGLAEVAVLGVQGVRGERQLAVVLPAAAGTAGSTAAGPPTEFGAYTGTDGALKW